MTRLVLSLSVSSAVLIVGLFAAWVQSRNFARAAELDRMQREGDWYLRRSTGLRVQVEAMEFDLRVEQDISMDRGDQPRSGGRD